MSLRFTVLASGSRGNACLVQSNGFGVLLDGGLPARDLRNRLQQGGHSLDSFQAMLLTHTHSDHWNDSTLGLLLRRGLPLYCHPSHHDILQRYSRYYARLQAAGLLRAFQPGEEFVLASELTCIALPVCHDGGETFGFRFRGPGDLFGTAATIGYASDLGTWDETLARELANVDLLAIEFNHDVDLELRSSRPMRLIERVLSEQGHLSNEQAAQLLQAVLQLSEPGRLRHLVQLHLSEDCNRPELARRSVQQVIEATAFEIQVHTAAQHKPGKTLHVTPGRAKRRRSASQEVSLPGRSSEM